MAEEPKPLEPSSDEAPPRRARVRRLLVRTVAVLVAVVAALIVSFLTVELGPTLRERAERAGSAYIRRPMHIGRLSARMLPGVYVVEDVMIEGLTPQDRP